MTESTAPPAGATRGNDRPLPLLFAAVLLLAGVPRILAAWLDQGVLWPDEIYSALEQGHRLAFGYGFIPWDIQDGMRSWIFPGALGAIFRLSALAGASDALTLVRIAKLAMVCASLAAVHGAMMLARRRAGNVAALLAGTFAGALPIAVVFAHHAFLDVAVAPLLTWAALLLAAPPAGFAPAAGASPRPTPAVAAGALLGLALALRPPLAPSLVLLAGPFLRGRRRETVFAAAAVGGAFAIGAGLVDWITLGAPFHSLTAYVGWLHAHADEFSVEPALFYPLYLWSSTGPVLLIGLAAAAIAARRAPVEAATVIAFVTAHSVIAHKEIRYLLPIVPLAASLAGAGLAEVLGTRLSRPALLACAAAVAGEQGIRAASNTLGEYGLYRGQPWERVRPWHFEEEKNRFLLDAGRRADLCGLVDFAGRSLAFGGGYTYLHRDVPLFSVRDPAVFGTPVLQESVNYAITPPETRAAGWSPVALGRTMWLQRREGTCVPHPELDNHRMPHPPAQRPAKAVTSTAASTTASSSAESPAASPPAASSSSGSPPDPSR